MKIEEIMTGDVVYAEVPGSAAEALELVIKKNLSGVPVVKRGTKELIGIVTRNDFSRRPEETQLALLMTRDVAMITPETDIKEAAKIFLERRFRRLPVVKNSELLGIVTVSDVIWRAVAKMQTEETIEKYMSKNITAIWEGTPLKVAYELMRLSGARALPVLNSEGSLCGIVADTDLLKVAQLTESTLKSEMSAGSEGDKWGWDSKNVIYITKKRLELPEMAVKDVMIKNVVSATKKTSVSECAKKMAKMKVEQVPVIDAEGNIIGMIRDVDLLKAIG
ncbi:MAG: CBS domain-containing protein [Euryarchaeota archaeon]|nr:CBS domain-containing protein [Euryarchaeota archaeon]